MSVYARLRGESKLQFFATGEELQIQVVKYVFNENRIPKKWRIIIGTDIVHIANEMMCNIIEANNIYADTQEKLDYRIALQTKAIANVRQIDQQIRLLLNVVETATPDSVKEICKLIYEEEEHLRKWKKTSKLVK